MKDQTDQHQRALTAKSVSQLGDSLYRELSTQSNLVFSPLGVYCVLRMLLEGARGETHSAISQLLYQDSEPVSMDGFQSLMDQLHKAFQVSIANGIWIQEGYGFEPEFIAQIHKLMRVQAENLDFEGQPAQAGERINTWVAEQTRGRIDAVLSPSDISELTRGILVDALYFNAAWVHPFSDPRPGTFHLFEGTQIEVPIMGTSIFGLNFVKRGDYWAVELPYQKDRYRGSAFSMILVVPASPGIEAFGALESHLSQSDVIFQGAERREVILSMPPFKVLGCHSLVPVLAGLGQGKFFDEGADFTGISEEVGFHVDKILQNSYIRVDQYGTEAAAATYGTFVGAYMPPEEIRLTIDRPFLFMLVEKESGLILFQGKVVNPLAG